MKFRAVRPAAIGKVDAVIVPLASDGTAPSGLPRGIKTIVDRIAKDEVGAGRLYGVTTHHADPRVVVVGMGKAAELDTERARNVASAGIKSLWRGNAKRVAIFVPGGGGPRARRGGGGPQARSDGALSEDRAAQAAVEGAVYAMWRPEVHRTRAEERRLPPIDSVLLVTTRAATQPIARGQAVGEAVNLQRRLANEPANKMTPTILADEARALAKRTGVQVEVLDRDKCAALGMGSYLSVVAVTLKQKRFIVVRYRGTGGMGFDLAGAGKALTLD